MDFGDFFNKKKNNRMQAQKPTATKVVKKKPKKQMKRYKNGHVAHNTTDNEFLKEIFHNEHRCKPLRSVTRLRPLPDTAVRPMPGLSRSSWRGRKTSRFPEIR